jgi:aminoglycoside phosphotransferase (APT) family kinase protein
MERCPQCGSGGEVLAALGGSAVSVPEVIAICEDTSILGCPFYLMERVDGRTLRDHDDTAGLSVAKRRALSTSLVETLAALHSIEPASVGLGDWGRPTGYLDRQLHRWKQQWGRVKTPGRRDTGEVYAQLVRRTPSTTMPGFVHGDYKLDNVMVARSDPARILAVLDWEMATHGDVLADLGWLISLWDEPGETPNPVSAAPPRTPASSAATKSWSCTHMLASATSRTWTGTWPSRTSNSRSSWSRSITAGSFRAPTRAQAPTSARWSNRSCNEQSKPCPEVGHSSQSIGI